MGSMQPGRGNIANRQGEAATTQREARAEIPIYVEGLQFPSLTDVREKPASMCIQGLKMSTWVSMAS